MKKLKLSDVQTTYNWKDYKGNKHESTNISLSKLTGMKIIDIVGYTSEQFGNDVPVFHVSTILFEGDTHLSLEGEHDIAYIPNQQKIPNLDNETLHDLYIQENGEDLDKGGFLDYGQL